MGFKEGQDVQRGFLLAEIDPRTYQAQYDQAVAKKAQDEATLANARLDVDRYTRLAASNSGSKQQADTQKALVAQLEAQVQGDQAAIDNTKTMLSYTKILAPIDGRTGIRLLDEGNLVQANDTNGIVVITQVKPISVLFNLPQQQFPQVNQAFADTVVEGDTVRSRVMTGKPARQLRTAWTEAWESDDSPGPLPMPLQGIIYNYAARRVSRVQRKELSGFPVGQIVGRLNTVRPTKDVIFEMVEEWIETTQRLNNLIEA